MSTDIGIVKINQYYKFHKLLLVADFKVKYLNFILFETMGSYSLSLYLAFSIMELVPILLSWCCI